MRKGFLKRNRPSGRPLGNLLLSYWINKGKLMEVTAVQPWELHGNAKDYVCTESTRKLCMEEDNGHLCRMLLTGQKGAEIRLPGFRFSSVSFLVELLMESWSREDRFKWEGKEKHCIYSRFLGWNSTNFCCSYWVFMSLLNKDFSMYVFRWIFIYF